MPNFKRDNDLRNFFILKVGIWTFDVDGLLGLGKFKLTGFVKVWFSTLGNLWGGKNAVDPVYAPYAPGLTDGEATGVLVLCDISSPWTT